MGQMLNPGDRFPHLELEVVGGDKLVLPDEFAGSRAYIMVYRGHW